MILITPNVRFVNTIIMRKSNIGKVRDCVKTLRIVSFVALAISAIVSTDLLINLLGNMVPEMNDGLTIHTVLLPGKLFFGDSLWTLEKFYKAFVSSSLITLAVFVENVILAIAGIARK